MLTTDNLLKGEHIRLTAITEDDLPVIASWHDDSRFSRNIGLSPSVPMPVDANWLKRVNESNTDYEFAVRLLDKPDIIGTVGLDGIKWHHGMAYISIGIGLAPHRGQGYGREAMRLLTRLAFDELNLRRLCLTVFNYNTAAIALCESLGWTREGTARQHILRDGQTHDMHYYGLLAHEWRGGQST